MCYTRRPPPNELNVDIATEASRQPRPARIHCTRAASPPPPPTPNPRAVSTSPPSGNYPCNDGAPSRCPRPPREGRERGTRACNVRVSAADLVDGRRRRGSGRQRCGSLQPCYKAIVVVIVFMVPRKPNCEADIHAPIRNHAWNRPSRGHFCLFRVCRVVAAAAAARFQSRLVSGSWVLLGVWLREGGRERKLMMEQRREGRRGAGMRRIGRRMPSSSR